MCNDCDPAKAVMSQGGVTPSRLRDSQLTTCTSHSPSKLALLGVMMQWMPAIAPFRSD